MFGLGNYYCENLNHFSAAQTYLTFTGLGEEIGMSRDSVKEEQLEKGSPLKLVLKITDFTLGCESCAFSTKDRQWTEYLDFGPHGLSVIRNTSAHRFRVAISTQCQILSPYLCNI